MTTINKDRESVTKNVLQIIANQLQLPVEEIAEEHKLQDDLGADEADIREIARSIGTEYQIVLRDTDLEDKETVDQLIELTMVKIAAA